MKLTPTKCWKCDADDLPTPSWEYLAGFIDGEGCFLITEYDNRRYGQRSKGQRHCITFGQKVDRINVFLRVIRRLEEDGIQFSLTIDKGTREERGNTPMVYVRVQSKKEIGKMLSLMLPYLIIRRKDAEELFKNIQKGGQRYVPKN